MVEAMLAVPPISNDRGKHQRHAEWAGYADGETVVSGERKKQAEQGLHQLAEKTRRGGEIAGLLLRPVVTLALCLSTRVPLTRVQCKRENRPHVKIVQEKFRREKVNL